MADFKGMEVPVGAEIEVVVPTEGLGVWGALDYYYGLSFRAKIVATTNTLFCAEITHSGFYGAYDSADNAVSGKPVKVLIDPEKVQSAEWSGNILRITLGK